MKINSGLNLATAGLTTFSNAYLYAPSPAPAGIGTLILNPLPAPSPVSWMVPINLG